MDAPQECALPPALSQKELIRWPFCQEHDDSMKRRYSGPDTEHGSGFFRCGRLFLLLSGVLSGLFFVVAPAYALTVDVQALEGAILTPAMQQNIRAHLEELESLKYRMEPDLLLRRTRAQLEAALQALGYYQPVIVLIQDDDQPDRVTARVSPGEAVRVSQMQLHFLGEAGNDIAFTTLSETLPLHEGDILHHGFYEACKTAVENLAQERGYFDAKWITHEVDVSEDMRTAVLRLSFDSGLRYRFGNVEFVRSTQAAVAQGAVAQGAADPAQKEDQPAAFTTLNDKVLRPLVPFDQGDAYDAGKVLALNKSLIDSRYFDEVRVRVLREQAQDRVIPLRIELRERLPNTMGIGMGYATDVGPRGRLTWQKPWINDRGHALSGSVEVSPVRQTIEAEYSIPLTHPFEDTIRMQYGVQREDVEETDTITTKTTLGIQHQYFTPKRWQESRYLRFEREHFERGDETGSTNMILPGVTVSRTRSRGGVDPYWGEKQFYQLEFASENLFSDLSLVRFRAGGRLIRTYHDRHHIELRGDIGAVSSNQFDRVPPSMRFFAGGDQSIRGFAYKSIGPKDENGEVVGGRYLTVGSAEYQYRLHGRWRLAAFIDGGSAYDDIAEDFASGAGVGVRWLSPVGPVRLDFAWGMSDPENPFRIHFFMGPAL